MTEEKRLPHRVQLKRAKGYRIEPDTVICDRRSVWGNWYSVIRLKLNKSTVVDTRPTKRDLHNTTNTYDNCVNTSIQLFDYDIENMPQDKRREWLRPLLGKNLACWCPETSECHTDILFKWLEIEFGQEYEAC